MNWCAQCPHYRIQSCALQNPVLRLLLIAGCEARRATMHATDGLQTSISRKDCVDRTSVGGLLTRPTIRVQVPLLEFPPRPSSMRKKIERGMDMVIGGNVGGLCRGKGTCRHHNRHIIFMLSLEARRTRTTEQGTAKPLGDSLEESSEDPPSITTTKNHDHQEPPL